MNNELDIKDFLKKQEHTPIIDVRSPAEFKKAHIPGAFNIPLFENEERSKVGTVYKKQSKEKAVLLGLEIVGPKMKDFVLQAQDIIPGKDILVHCWRGGMRSSSMAWLFRTAGLKPKVLKGGYKAYRTHLHKELAQEAKIIILSGSTGSGKTDILHSLKNKGQQIIDLEGLAHHKGSVFGSIGEQEQLQNEQFENNLHFEWSKLNKTKVIWIEDEGASIGRNYIPREFFLNMRKAPIIKINISKEIRLKRLVKEYTNVNQELLINYLNKIQKRLGSLETKTAIEAVEKNNYRIAIDYTLTYYDKAYAHGLQKRKDPTIFELNLSEDKSDKNAELIIELYKKLKL